MALQGVRRTPCASCPYRRDVPSGIWEAAEYRKLRSYDGDVPEQAMARATGLFYCRQLTDELCAGWVGCHDMENSLAMRMHHQLTDAEAVLDYVSPVPLFSSGAEAAAHGMRDIGNPGPEARRLIEKIRLIRERRAPETEEKP